MAKTNAALHPEKSLPGLIARDESFYARNPAGFRWKHRLWVMSFFMLGSDLLCLLASAGLALCLWYQVRKDFLPARYVLALIPIAACLIVIYYVMRLYPCVGIGPVEELRRLTIGSFLTMVGLAATSFFLGNASSWSRAILGLGWIFTSLSIPISRKIFRRLAVRLNLWRMPVAVIGDPLDARKIYDRLRRRPLTGLWPVVCIASSSVRQFLPELAGQMHEPSFDGIEIAVITFGQASLADAKAVLLSQTHTFQRIIVILDEGPSGSLWTTSLHLVEYQGLEVTHNLLHPFQKALKRCVDLVFILLTLPFWAPFTLLAAVLIKLDSAGPVFYSQKRIGYGGKEIRVWKFRSMARNADELLVGFLDGQPALQAEWQQSYKLKRDPRVTRFGSLLRRTSLDELPQIWNILRGEMSFIGPRPILQDEISLYGQEFEIYKQVLPGLTGMWQISGRNDLPYRERVNLDVYYVQNWSVWLDIHILMHTVLTVLEGRGAY